MKRLAWFAGMILLTAGAVVIAPTTPRAYAEKAEAAALTPAASVAGTTWAGVDSDGDFYEYTFLPGGGIRYRTNTAGRLQTYENTGDYWSQNGPLVIFVMRNYVTRIGTITGTRIGGDAWNFAGRRWTWKADLKP
jgi:hypothetical protein